MLWATRRAARATLASKGPAHPRQDATSRRQLRAEDTGMRDTRTRIHTHAHTHTYDQRGEPRHQCHRQPQAAVYSSHRGKAPPPHAQPQPALALSDDVIAAAAPLPSATSARSCDAPSAAHAAASRARPGTSAAAAAVAPSVGRSVAAVSVSVRRRGRGYLASSTMRREVSAVAKLACPGEASGRHRA